ERDQRFGEVRLFVTLRRKGGAEQQSEQRPEKQPPAEEMTFSAFTTVVEANAQTLFAQWPWRRSIGGPYQPYALAPDGKCFAVVFYPDGTAENQNPLHLTFLLNFFDELRRRTVTE